MLQGGRRRATHAKSSAGRRISPTVAEALALLYSHRVTERRDICVGRPTHRRWLVGSRDNWAVGHVSGNEGASVPSLDGPAPSPSHDERIFSASVGLRIG